MLILQWTYQEEKANVGKTEIFDCSGQGKSRVSRKDVTRRDRLSDVGDERDTLSPKAEQRWKQFKMRERRC